MKVTTERLEDSQVLLHIEVEPERTAKSIDQAYHRLVNRVSIPGFRKGKAPRHVVERVVGHETLVHEGIEALLPAVFREAVDETGIVPIDEPQIDIVQETPLIVNMTVPVRPTVELGDYRDIHAEQKQVTVLEEDVDRVLEQLRKQSAEWLPVERPAQAGDRVSIDVTGRIRGAPLLYNPEGEALLQTETGELVLDEKGAQYTIVPESSVPVRGFAEQLIGMKAAEDKRFELTFPPEYPDRQLANKAVIFHVVMHSVKEERLPELDDQLAKTVGDYATLADLRTTVRENLQRSAEREAENELREHVLNMVADKAHIELPPTMVEREIDRLVGRAERQLRESNISLDEYLRSTKKSKEDLRAEYRTGAIGNLRHYLVLEEVANAEEVAVTPEEVDAEIKRVGQLFGEHAAEATRTLNEPERREDLAGDIRHRKALDRLVAIATGKATEEPSAESGSAGEESEAK